MKKISWKQQKLIFALFKYILYEELLYKPPTKVKTGVPVKIDENELSDIKNTTWNWFQPLFFICIYTKSLPAYFN